MSTTSTVSGSNRLNLDDNGLLSVILDMVPLSIVISTFAEGKILLANKAFHENTGFCTDELNNPGKSTSKLYFNPEDQKNFREALKANGRVDEFPIRLQDKQLHLYTVRLTGRRIRYRYSDCVLSVSTSFIPVKIADDAIRKNEERYQGILQRIAEGYFEADLSGHFLFFNNAMTRITGYSAEELKGMNFRAYTSTSLQEYLHRSFNEVFRTGAEKTINYEIIRKDGTLVYVETSIGLLCDKSGSPSGFYGVMRDRTEQQGVEEALRQSERNNRTILELAPDVVTIGSLDDGRYQYVNEAFCSETGYTAEEAIGRTPIELGIYVNPDDRKSMVKDLLRDRRIVDREIAVTTKEGSVRHHLLSSRIISIENQNCLLSIGKDVTQQKKLESQLLQAQKMEAIGTLAGGVAHDFNNLLMGIQGNLSLAETELDPASPLHRRLENIGQYVKAGAELTSQLLGAAKGGKYEAKSTDLNQIVESSSNLFGRTRKEIRIHKKLQKPLWPVEVDRGQFNQVLLNLYVNAWQAMPDGGDLYLESKNVHLTDESVQPFNISPGNYAKLSITDTGVGIDKENLKRIFEPFFTTKGMGRGTGLGLASAYGIIANHGGIINAYSEKGEGTTFNIYLPTSAKPVKAATAPSAEMIRGEETLLFVDDDEGILEIGKMMLEKLGYKVIPARNGKEAIEIYHRRHAEIDLVILDMIMPEVSGGETFDELKKINPEVKVLLSSGYSINGQAQGILDRGCMGFIQKPFGLENLSVKLRQILSGNQPGFHFSLP